MSDDPFNLIISRWIPVQVIGEGGLRLVGLREAIEQARTFTGIEDASPLQTAALYRLLLAVLHRALQGPQDVYDVADWWRDGFPQALLDTYFHHHEPRFELFGEAPFMQVADLPLEGFSQSWERLGAEVGGGNTTLLFNTARRTGHVPFAQDAGTAARRLLEHQSFALGGLTRKFTASASGAPSATAALILARGQNLHETLCLNLVPYTQGLDQDLPPWELPPATTESMKAFYPNGGKEKRSQPLWGPVQGYVWPGRSIRLVQEPDGRVSQVAYAEGVPPKLVEGWQDPMTALRRLKDGTFYPMKLSAERLFWRDFSAVVPDLARETVVNEEKGEASVREGRAPLVLGHALALYRELGLENQPIPMQVFGQVNDQAKIELWRTERYDLPTSAQDPHLFQHVTTALNEAQETRDVLSSALRGLAGRLLSAGGRDAHKDDVTRLARSLGGEQAYWATLEDAFRIFLRHLSGDVDAALNTWRADLARVAANAWTLASRSAGKDGRALRARYESERFLNKHLSERRGGSYDTVQTPPA